MSSLIMSAIVAIVALFHLIMKRFMRKGKIKTTYCTIWIIDAVFAICGTVLSFILYGYYFSPFLTIRNTLIVVSCILLILIFVCVAPTGIALFAKKKNKEHEAILLAEYRLNDTFGMVRNCFLFVLFILPVFFVAIGKSKIFPVVALWREADVCGGFCFIAFLLLLPMCIRQAIFWMRSLASTTTDTEEQILWQYRVRLRYEHRNYKL